MHISTLLIQHGILKGLWSVVLLLYREIQTYLFIISIWNVVLLCLMIDLVRLSLKRQYIHKMNGFEWQHRKNYHEIILPKNYHEIVLPKIHLLLIRIPTMVNVDKICGKSVMQILWKPGIISPSINTPIWVYL